MLGLVLVLAQVTVDWGSVQAEIERHRCDVEGRSVLRSAREDCGHAAAESPLERDVERAVRLAYDVLTGSAVPINTDEIYTAVVPRLRSTCEDCPRYPPAEPDPMSWKTFSEYIASYVAYLPENPVPWKVCGGMPLIGWDMDDARTRRRLRAGRLVANASPLLWDKLFELEDDDYERMIAADGDLFAQACTVLAKHQNDFGIWLHSCP